MTQILLTSSLLILLILPLRRLLRGKVSHRLLYGIWLLVALRLLIPFQFGQFQYSMATLTEQSQPIQQFQSALQKPVATPSRNEVNEPLPETTLPTQNEPQVQVVEQTTAPSLQEVLTAIWVGGMMIMGIWFLTTNLLFLHRAKQGAIPLPEVEDTIPVRISQHVPTPCLVGLIRPVIYLTPTSAEDLQRREHVLIHEQTHLRHGDHIWSWIRCLCLCIYWFDPLVWLAAILSKRDCELACDESALKKLGDGERIAYGKTLLETVTQHRSPTHILETATAMNETKKQLKERVSYIVKKPKNLVIATVALILVAAIAAGCAFAGSKPTEQLQDADPPSITDPTEDLTAPTTEPTNPTVDLTEPSTELTDSTVDLTEPTTEPTDPVLDLSKLPFTDGTPKEALLGRWLAHMLIDDHTILTYELRFYEDNSAVYRWGYYGSTLIEQLEGTWHPAGDGYGVDDYILELVPTGGSLHDEGIQYYEYYGVLELRSTEDGSAIKASYKDGTPLFNHYSDTELILYRYEAGSDYYEIPLQPLGTTLEDVFGRS